MQDAFRRLSIDERDQVADLLGEPAFRAFLKLLEGMATEQEQKVITLAVSDGVDRVIHQKLRAEGARSIIRDIARVPEHIRKITKKDNEG